MKRILLITAFCLLVPSICAFGQSGKVKPKPTPAPVTIDTKETIYSETGVYVRRRIYKPEILKKRKKKKKKSKKQATRKAPVIQDVSQQVEEDDDELITIDSSFVMIPVSVHDRNGLYIPNLTKENFKVFEDGVEQEIEYFATSEQPFTVVLLIDVSPSTEYRIEEIREAAKAFVDELKPQDRVLVVSFDSAIRVLAEATNDRRRIHKAIDRANFGGGTALYDAIDFTFKKRLRNITGKKAVVLFTDGVDTTSRRSDYLMNIDEVEESDVTIYPIYYNTYRRMVRRDVFNDPLGRRPRYGQVKGTRPKDYAVGRQYLLELAGSTGGRIFIPEKTDDGLRNAFFGIAEELRRQYNLGYSPPEDGKPGERKSIKVRINRPKLVVRNRTSYVVGQKKQ